jgi:hypothetical protein
MTTRLALIWGPPLGPKSDRNRLHLDLAPLGKQVDPDGSEFRVLGPQMADTRDARGMASASSKRGLDFIEVLAAVLAARRVERAVRIVGRHSIKR